MRYAVLQSHMMEQIEIKVKGDLVMKGKNGLWLIIFVGMIVLLIGCGSKGESGQGTQPVPEGQGQAKDVADVPAEGKAETVVASEEQSTEDKNVAEEGQPSGIGSSAEAEQPAAIQQQEPVGQPAAASGNVGDIGADKAKEIALEHVGITEEQTTAMRVKQDYDDGKLEYEVEFCVGGQEYDYKIDAAGSILGYDYSLDKNTFPASDGNTGISEEEAKAFALSQVPGATDSDIRIQSDYDDGRAVYEGKIIYNEIEYEFEINAADGTILEWEAGSVFD